MESVVDWLVKKDDDPLRRTDGRFSWSRMYIRYYYTAYTTAYYSISTIRTSKNRKTSPVS
jgi:hypothetical protein